MSVLETNPGPLREQQVLFTAELPHRPCYFWRSPVQVPLALNSLSNLLVLPPSLPTAVHTSGVICNVLSLCSVLPSQRTGTALHLKWEYCLRNCTVSTDAGDGLRHSSVRKVHKVLDLDPSRTQHKSVAMHNIYLLISQGNVWQLSLTC